MLRQYIYSADQAGLQSWPSGELRLDGIEVTTDPSEASLFVVPGNLSLFANDGILQMDRLYKLPYLAGNEHRTAFFDVSDNFRQSIKLPFIFIRCDARSWMFKDDPGTVSVAWPVDDHSGCIDVPYTGHLFDVSFQGWLSTDTRTISSNACKNNPDLKCDIAQYNDFTGYIFYEPEGIRRRAEFRRSMKESRIALCPESIPGVLPYRFFEAMSAGRIPLLVSSDYVLPFSKEIPYADFVLFCERDNAVDADKVALGFIRNHTDTEIIDRGKLARQWWNARLDCRRWPDIMGMAVRRKMKELGLTTEEVLCS